MAEEFLEKIYEDSMIIEYLQEYIFNVLADRESVINECYNHGAAGVERILSVIAQSDMAMAESLQNAMLKIVEHYGDRKRAVALLKRKVFPLLYKYMSDYTGIEVESGKYVLKSADTGFLTIRDTEQDLYLHDPSDPAGEAYQRAQNLVKPEMERFLIYGCGLGYLAWQIYRVSEGTIDICIFEEDADIIEFARKYGVLDRIPEVRLKVFCDPDVKYLSERFIEEVQSAGVPAGIEISPWKRSVLENKGCSDAFYLIQSEGLRRDSFFRIGLNRKMNRRLKTITFEDIYQKYNNTGWITVSAGPSLEEQIRFIKENKKTFGILAVNTVVRRLINEGVIPDIVVALDPSKIMVSQIERVEIPDNVPLIADIDVYWQYADRFPGPVYFIDSEVSGGQDDWRIDGTVACLAIEAAVRLNAKEVYLCGQDLAFPRGKAYAEGMPHDPENREKDVFMVRSVDGRSVETSSIFNLFRHAIERKIEEHKDVSFYNMSNKGAFIKGTREYKNKSYDSGD